MCRPHCLPEVSCAERLSAGYQASYMGYCSPFLLWRWELQHSQLKCQVQRESVAQEEVIVDAFDGLVCSFQTQEENQK